MLESLSGVLNRINEIKSRIEEIKAIGKRPETRPADLNTNAAKDENSQYNRKFSDILNEVMAENNTLPGSDRLLDYDKVNEIVGSKNDSKELLSMLYKKGLQNNGNSNVDGLIDEASELFHVDKPLIKAVIQQESGFNPEAVSQKGAMGLMQLMPRTAELLGISNPFDIKENVLGGTRYLKALLSKYNGDLNLSLAAYNAGPEAVDRFGGIPPYEETQEYVKNVLRYYNDYKNFE